MLTATEQLIYNVFKAQTASLDSEASMIAVAKVLASIIGNSQLKVFGSLSCELFTPTVSVATNEKVIFNDVSANTNLNNITIVNNEIVIPVAGKYRIVISGYFNANGASRIGTAKVIHNGSYLSTEDKVAKSSVFNSGSYDVGFCKEIILDLSVNDTIGMGYYMSHSNIVLFGATLIVERL